MPKRFVDTDMYKKKWYRKLPLRIKCLWEWLRLSCDHAGVLEFDPERASFDLGDEFSWEDLKYFEHRISKIKGDKIYLTDFISFQYGELTESCNPHKAIIKTIKKHGIAKGTFKGTLRVPVRVQEKEKEKEKEKKGMAQGSFEKDVLVLFNDITGRRFAVSSKNNMKFVAARQNEGSYSIDDYKKVITLKFNQWRDNPEMSGKIRPQTILGPLFEGYLQEAMHQPKTQEQKFKDLMEEHTYEEKLEMLKKQQEANEQI